MRDFPITRHRLLTADEERALAARIRGDDPADAKAAVNEMVAHNLRLAAWFATTRRRHYGLDLEDLYQECVLGLIEAAGRFDPARGVRFETYAWYWMRHQTRAAEEKRFAVAVPRWVYDRVTWTDDRLMTLGEEKRDHVKSARRAIFTPTYRLGNCPDHVTDAVESLAAPEVGLDDVIDGRDALALVDRLPPRYGQVIRRRFGIPKQSLSTIGEALGITKERVRQIEIEAIRRLRELAGVETGGGRWAKRRSL